MIEPARVLRIVLRYQEGDETIYAKVHSRDPFESKPCSYKQLCNAIFRHNYVLNRIAQIYVFGKYFIIDQVRLDRAFLGKPCLGAKQLDIGRLCLVSDIDSL